MRRTKEHLVMHRPSTNLVEGIQIWRLLALRSIDDVMF